MAATVKRRSYRQILGPAICCLLVLSTALALRLYGADAGAQGTARPTGKETSAPQAPAPEFSIAGGIYTTNLSVRIGSDAGTVRYTLDGSDPTEKSRAYSGPIKVGQSTVIRARSFDRGATPSDIVSQTYSLV